MEQEATYFNPPTIDTKDDSFVLQDKKEVEQRDSSRSVLQVQGLEAGLQGLTGFFSSQPPPVSAPTYGGATDRGGTAGVAAASGL